MKSPEFLPRGVASFFFLPLQAHFGFDSVASRISVRFPERNSSLHSLDFCVLSYFIAA